MARRDPLSRSKRITTPTSVGAITNGNARSAIGPNVISRLPPESQNGSQLPSGCAGLPAVGTTRNTIAMSTATTIARLGAPDNPISTPAVTTPANANVCSEPSSARSTTTHDPAATAASTSKRLVAEV